MKEWRWSRDELDDNGKKTYLSLAPEENQAFQRGFLDRQSESCGTDRIRIEDSNEEVAADDGATT